MVLRVTNCFLHIPSTALATTSTLHALSIIITTFHCSPSHTILPPSLPSTSPSSPSPLLHSHILRQNGQYVYVCMFVHPLSVLWGCTLPLAHERQGLAGWTRPLTLLCHPLQLTQGQPDQRVGSRVLCQPVPAGHSVSTHVCTPHELLSAMSLVIGLEYSQSSVCVCSLASSPYGIAQ